jgi:hypothetical protein
MKCRTFYKYYLNLEEESNEGKKEDDTSRKEKDDS